MAEAIYPWLSFRLVPGQLLIAVGTAALAVVTTAEIKMPVAPELGRRGHVVADGDRDGPRIPFQPTHAAQHRLPRLRRRSAAA